MSLAETPFVGSASARAVHGFAAGAPAYLVGAGRDGAPVADAPVAGALHELGLEPRGLGGPDASAALLRLADAAAQAHTADESLPVVVVAAGLRMSAVALLDLLDRPGAATSVASMEPTAVHGDIKGFALLRVDQEERQVHSAGSARHVVTAPTNLAVGVLLVAAADLPDAIRLWRAAAASPCAADPAVDPFDLALVALVRGGVRVGAVPLGPYDVGRLGSRATGARGSAWEQRLRGASRGGDGFFSTFVIRPVSRRLTRIGLSHGWSPNAVTVTSLALGLLAAALAATDSRAAWVAAAVLLQLALVVDCVDGEIARFTRRFSALGAWLDAVGDRVKEYSLIAAVAWLSVRRGEPMWLLATIALALVTLRHLEDYAYLHRNKASRAHLVPDQLVVDQVRDLGADHARVTLPHAPSRRQQVTYWAKKVMHMPIAERYLLLSLGLLTFNARVLLWAISVAVALALAWTLGGRTARALLRRDGYRPDPHVSGASWGHLDHQVDLGPLARAAGRVRGLPFPAAIVGVLVVVVVAVASAVGGGVTWLTVLLVLVGCLLVGAGCRPPLQHPLGWQASALLWGAEAVLVLSLVADLPKSSQWCAYAYLASVAWHRYDVVYRLRDTAQAAASWVTTATLGVDGRMVALVVLVALGVPTQPVLGWAALLLILVYAAESARAWRTWLRAQHQGFSPMADSEPEVAL